MSGMSGQLLRFPPPRWFPYLATASLFLTCASSVTVAFYLHQVSGVPYISDTITTPPESCYFGFFLNLYALLLGLSIWNVYTHAVHENRLETTACSVGLTAAFGVAIVANFQETVVFPVHIAGAMLAFGLASVYIWMRVILSPYFRKLRAVCATGCAICFAVTAITGAISYYQFKGTDILHWGRNDGGFEMHVTSVISEWILAGFVSIFVLTLSRDIKCGEEERPLMSSGQADSEAFRRESA